MFLSDISVRRPVFATVVALLLVVFGITSYTRLTVREFPDVDPPIVTVETIYTGAAAETVDNRVTEIIEDRISGVEDLKSIDSVSQDGSSRITLEFEIDRDLDAAANDVRDRVSRVLDDLPDEADAPEISKADAGSEVILWLNLTSPVLNQLELTDIADRLIVDRISALDGVAFVRIGGEKRTAMRVWLNQQALAAHDLTAGDVEDVLAAQNVELPAGRLESPQRDFTLRVPRPYAAPEQFASMIVKVGAGGEIVRLGQVARVEVAAEDLRTDLRSNDEPAVGVGVTRQSRANTIEVVDQVKALLPELRNSLPEEVTLNLSYDTSVFIRESIAEVYRTIGMAAGLVVLVIFLFLGSVRATAPPAITVPVSIVASFIVLSAFGYSLNTLTLLALVLAIGLVVDDSIVVLENIYRRMENGEPPLVAAHRGTKQVGFAVIATTVVLVAVFVPIAFMEGVVGRLFTEYAFALAGAVCFSSLVALTLCPVLASKLLSREHGKSRMTVVLERGFRAVEAFYDRTLRWTLRNTPAMLAVFVVILAALVYTYRAIPGEFAPKEDRGVFFVFMTAPEGASFDYSSRYMAQIEKMLLPLLDSGEAQRVLARVPGSFSQVGDVNSGIGIVVLTPWSQRERSTQDIAQATFQELQRLPGVTAFAVVRQGLAQFGTRQPVQFVLGGDDYDELASWRDTILEAAREYPGLEGLDWDYRETKPKINVSVNLARAAELGVSVREIGRTLETLLGSRDVTDYLDRGQQYEVILQSDATLRESLDDLDQIYVRSERSGALTPLSNVITLREFAGPSELARYNRLRAITISANLAPGYALGDALAFLQQTAREKLPAKVRIDYKGESLEFVQSSGAAYFTFGLALVVVFLVLAAQFESFLHPLAVMSTVPLAVVGALLGLLITGQTMNIYSEIGLIMLIGLAAKNGILIVEFINQMRDEGHRFHEAILRASKRRLRPVVMTALSTAIGALPLILATGAGAESRRVLGVVIFSGVLVSAAMTLYMTPFFYNFFCRHTTSPEERSRAIDAYEATHPASEAD